MDDFMYNVFIAMLARTTCSEFDCEQCRSFYDSEECPCDKSQREEQIELAKTLYEEISSGERKNFHDIDFNLEELLDVIMDVVKEK